MDNSIQNIILERLCTALTDIVMDIVKLSKIDKNVQGVIMKNISSIRGILKPSSSSGDTQAALKESERQIATRSQSAKVKATEKSGTQQILPKKPTKQSKKDDASSMIEPTQQNYSSQSFPLQTTEKAVKNHIQKKSPDTNIDGVEITKLPSKGDTSSFILKTGRNEDLFNLLNEKSFWPLNTIVHQHNNRPKQFFRGQRRHINK